MHRDIKLENIMITYEAVIKLIDFGFSKKLEDSKGRANTKLGNKLNQDPNILKQPEQW